MDRPTTDQPQVSTHIFNLAVTYYSYLVVLQEPDVPAVHPLLQLLEDWQFILVLSLGLLCLLGNYM